MSFWDLVLFNKPVLQCHSIEEKQNTKRRQTLRDWGHYTTACSLVLPWKTAPIFRTAQVFLEALPYFNVVYLGTKSQCAVGWNQSTPQTWWRQGKHIPKMQAGKPISLLTIEHKFDFELFKEPHIWKIIIWTEEVASPEEHLPSTSESLGLVPNTKNKQE